MAGPVTLKAGAYPAAAGGLQGLRELTAVEIKNQVAGVVTLKFATDTDGNGTGELRNGRMYPVSILEKEMKR